MRDHRHDRVLFDTEKDLKRELEKWSMVQGSIFQHKSRIKWLQLGNSNSAYFFANMKNRTAYSQIKKLKLPDGSWTKTDMEVKNVIIEFYKNLLGTTTNHLPTIDPTVCTRGNVLIRSQEIH